MTERLSSPPLLRENALDNDGIIGEHCIAKKCGFLTDLPKFIAEISVFYYRAILSGDMCVAGTPHHTGLHSGYPDPMPIATGG
jgi:hypothetical protein